MSISELATGNTMQQWQHLQHHACPAAAQHGTTWSHWKGSLIYMARTVSHLLVWCHNFFGNRGSPKLGVPMVTWHQLLMPTSSSSRNSGRSHGKHSSTIVSILAPPVTVTATVTARVHGILNATIVTDAVAASKWTTCHYCCHWCMCTYITANGRVALT